MCRWVLLGLTTLLCCLRSEAFAQASPPPSVAEGSSVAAELLNLDALTEQGKSLVAQAAAGNGTAGVTLAKYPGHYTMLTARAKSGGAEVHREWNDFLFVLDGSGTELTGGTVVDAKEQPGGEVRGSRIDGGVPHPLKKGDILHIPPGTPHQALEKPGETITIFVIKVAAPGSSAETAR